MFVGARCGGPIADEVLEPLVVGDVSFGKPTASVQSTPCDGRTGLCYSILVFYFCFNSGDESLSLSLSKRPGNT